MKDKKEKIYKNGTPYSDKSWQKWYANKSSKEIAMEKEGIQYVK